MQLRYALEKTAFPSVMCILARTIAMTWATLCAANSGGAALQAKPAPPLSHRRARRGFRISPLPTISTIRAAARRCGGAGYSINTLIRNSGSRKLSCFFSDVSAEPPLRAGFCLSQILGAGRKPVDRAALTRMNKRTSREDFLRDGRFFVLHCQIKRESVGVYCGNAFKQIRLNIRF